MQKDSTASKYIQQTKTKRFPNIPPPDNAIIYTDREIDVGALVPEMSLSTVPGQEGVAGWPRGIGHSLPTAGGGHLDTAKSSKHSHLPHWLPGKFN